MLFLKQQFIEEDFDFLPTTFLDAQQSKSRFYYNGIPCCNGHLDKKYTSTRTCRTCVVEKRSEFFASPKWKEKTSSSEYKEKKKFERIESKYELSPAQYRAKIHAQNNQCAICRSAFDFSDKKKRPVVDHDHFNGTVRGMLCGACNIMIGFAKDNPLTLRKAAYYIKKYKKQNEN
jgi:hypothetical protein